MHNNKALAFIGTYADESEPGLYVCRYNTENGSLKIVDAVSGLNNPTFLELDIKNKRLYVISDEPDPNETSAKSRYGAVSAFAIDTASGKLTLINKEITVPASTCHISMDYSNQCLMTSSYGGGMIGLSPIRGDGSVGQLSDMHQHKGSSVLPVQDRPRAHSLIMDPMNRYAVVCDLGMDQIVLYQLDLDRLKLIPHEKASVAPGAGPRHFTFHPSLPYGYVINELNATITGFNYHEELGQLEEIQTISTLPSEYKDSNACADIHISLDGIFLYGSNRGHDSIAVYKIDPSNGFLALVEYTPAGGKHPRNFALSPDGRFLLAANRDSNNIVSFHRYNQTGKLQPSGSTLDIAKPVCIKFMDLAFEG